MGLMVCYLHTYIKLCTPVNRAELGRELMLGHYLDTLLCGVLFGQFVVESSS